MGCLRPVGVALVAALALLPPAAWAQQHRDTEQRLEQVQRELREVAAERRRLEGRRGAAARELRQADEKVASAGRAARQTEADIAREQDALAELRARRGELDQRMARQREELAQLLRAAYTVGDHAALKLLLAQDRVGDANRMLAYHRHLQEQRAARIQVIHAELAELEEVEARIAERTRELEQVRARQREQLAQLEHERAQRSALVAGLEERYSDRQAREQALGRDARALQQVLERLRAAAARAEAERAAAAARAREAGGSRSPPVQVPRGAPVRVGGLGWPLAGNLVAGYGAAMPDGRRSSGILIGAPAGTTVQAVADGTVVFSEWMTGYGMIVIIDHGNDHMSLYAHNDALLRQAGDRVSRGDAVATVGNSGGQGQPALYFELRRGGKPIDPSTWLGRR